MPKYHTWRNECIDFRIPFVNVPIQSTHKSVCLKCMHSHVNISRGALEVIIFFLRSHGKDCSVRHVHPYEMGEPCYHQL